MITRQRGDSSIRQLLPHARPFPTGFPHRQNSELGHPSSCFFFHCEASNTSIFDATSRAEVGIWPCATVSRSPRLNDARLTRAAPRRHFPTSDQPRAVSRQSAARGPVLASALPARLGDMTDVMEVDGAPAGVKRKAGDAADGERAPRRIKVCTLALQPAPQLPISTLPFSTYALLVVMSRR